MRKFAISDIHGCNRTFKEVLQKIGLNKDDQLFLLGDYIDRGPDSKGVIDTIFDLQNEGYQVHCIKGNHEQMLMDVWQKNDLHYTRRWLMHGGAQTAESFGGFGIDEISEKYRDFFNGLEHSIISDEHILVHAGLDFGTTKDPMDVDHSMLWIRNWYYDIDYKWLGDRYIIHGHTPQTMEEIERMHAKYDLYRILDIDAGCCYNDIKGLGYLCVIELNEKKIFFQKNLEK